MPRWAVVVDWVVHPEGLVIAPEGVAGPPGLIRPSVEEEASSGGGAREDTPVGPKRHLWGVGALGSLAIRFAGLNKVRKKRQWQRRTYSLLAAQRHGSIGPVRASVLEASLLASIERE